MIFTITGDTLFLDGRPVATLDATMNASLRDTVEKFLDGRPLDCDEQAYNEGYKHGYQDAEGEYVND
jgi:hypothetical protein